MQVTNHVCIFVFNKSSSENKDLFIHRNISIIILSVTLQLMMTWYFKMAGNQQVRLTYSQVMRFSPLFKPEIIPVSWFFLKAYLYGLLNDPLVTQAVNQKWLTCNIYVQENSSWVIREVLPLYFLKVSILVFDSNRRCFLLLCTCLIQVQLVTVQKQNKDTY